MRGNKGREQVGLHYYPEPEHREQTARGLDGGAVDKLLVGLREDNLLNQFSGFPLYFLLTTNKLFIYIYAPMIVRGLV